jgi:hypothetical protein
MSQGKSTAADRGGFQLDGGEDLLPREVIHKSGARIQTPATQITAEGSVGAEDSRVGGLIQFSHCTMASGIQTA